VFFLQEKLKLATIIRFAKFEINCLRFSKIPSSGFLVYNFVTLGTEALKFRRGLPACTFGVTSHHGIL